MIPLQLGCVLRTAHRCRQMHSCPPTGQSHMPYALQRILHRLRRPHPTKPRANAMQQHSNNPPSLRLPSACSDSDTRLPRTLSASARPVVSSALWCLRTGTGRAIARWAASTAEGLWGRGGYSDSVAVRLSCMQVRRQYGHSRTLEVGSLRAYHCLSEQ